jgi:hypothetical protein
LKAWAAVLVLVLVLGALAPCQQATRPAAPESLKDGALLVGSPVELGEKLAFTVEASPLPRLAVLRGRRAAGGNAAFEVGGKVWGTAAGFDLGASLFDASLPLVGGGGRLALAILPSAPGITVDRVEIVPASRVRFVIRDQATKVEIPGQAFIESVEGGSPPMMGAAGGFPRERASWISSDGYGDLYAPAGSTVTFAARLTPFRGTTRQRHVLESRDNLLLTFLLPSDQLPEDATILEGPPRSGIAPEVQRAADRARGIGKRPKGFRVMPAAQLLADGQRAIEEAIAHPDVKFLATNETGPLLCPPPLLVTAELAGGELLHSNGPVILLVDRRRESGAVRAFIKVRLPEGVVADHLVVMAGQKRVEHAIHGPSTIPLDVVVPAGTPIGLVVSGPAPSGAPGQPPVAAFRVFKAP